ncbi:hypothetical protein Hanom_Chr16g01481111 [Helianthus anomalus]
MSIDELKSLLTPTGPSSPKSLSGCHYREPAQFLPEDFWLFLN